MPLWLKIKQCVYSDQGVIQRGGAGISLPQQKFPPPPQERCPHTLILAYTCICCSFIQGNSLFLGKFPPPLPRKISVSNPGDCPIPAYLYPFLHNTAVYCRNTHTVVQTPSAYSSRPYTGYAYVVITAVHYSV